MVLANLNQTRAESKANFADKNCRNKNLTEKRSLFLSNWGGLKAKTDLTVYECKKNENFRGTLFAFKCLFVDVDTTVFLLISS